jgi:hypothetical protein
MLLTAATGAHEDYHEFRALLCKITFFKYNFVLVQIQISYIIDSYGREVSLQQQKVDRWSSFMLLK